MSGIFLGMFLFFGFCAHQLAKREAQNQWERDHSPPQKVIRFVFGSYHLSLLEDPKKIQFFMRSLPATIDDNASFWKSEETLCLVFFLGPGEPIQAHVYCSSETRKGSLVSRSAKIHWHSLGRGWPGLEKSIDFLEEREKLFKKQVPQTIVRPQTDPREIFY